MKISTETITSANGMIAGRLGKIADMADRFEMEYPDELFDRIKWLQDNMKIPKMWLVSLMMLPRPHKGGGPNWAIRASWEKICDSHEDECYMLEEAVVKALEWFNYDWEGFAALDNGKKQNLILVASDCRRRIADELFEKHWKWEF